MVLIIIKCLLTRNGFLFSAVKPPVLVKPLQNAESPEVGTVKFQAKITGFPVPSATWYI